MLPSLCNVCVMIRDTRTYYAIKICFQYNDFYTMNPGHSTYGFKGISITIAQTLTLQVMECFSDWALAQLFPTCRLDSYEVGLSRLPQPHRARLANCKFIEERNLKALLIGVCIGLRSDRIGLDRT